MNLEMFLKNSRVVRVRNTPILTRYEVVTSDPKLVFASKETLDMHFGNVAISYGSGVINIDVPNRKRPIIPLKPALAECEENEYPIGISEMGDCLIDTLQTMYNALVVGQIGSGKTMYLRCLIASLASINEPCKLQMVIMDFKCVDLTVFDGLPHLLMPVITNHEDAIKALQIIKEEMEHRYDLFKRCGCRTLEQFIALGYTLPRIVIVVDEFGDLMNNDRKSSESLLQSIAQKCRACGIHLILSTQTPRAETLPGTIKAHLPTTVAFKTRSQLESRVSTEVNGCELLLGNGDGYYFTAKGEQIRFQGCYVSDEEIERLVQSMTEECDIIDVDHYQPPVLAQKKYTQEQTQMMYEIHRDKLSIRQIKGRYRIGQDKAAEYQRMADQIFASV